MSELPLSCQQALLAIEASPLELPGEVETHLRTCPACREARVLWLALEPTPEVLAPLGYFDQLPDRILRKLPPARRRWSNPARFLLWAAAGILVVAAGLGGYMAGRVNRTPLIEAAVPRTPSENLEAETPFQNPDDDLNQLLTLSPEEGKVLVKHLKSQSKPTK